MPKPKLATKVQDIIDLQDLPQEEERERNLPSSHRKTSQSISARARPGKVSQPGKTPIINSVSDDVAERANQYLSELDTFGAEDGVPDVEETLPSTQVKQMLPMVLSKEVITYNGHKINPEWVEVMDLPGVSKAEIRKLGRDVFSLLTDTPLNQIQVICTFTNTKDEVAGMAAWVQRNGVRESSLEVEALQVFEGYGAKAQLWYAKGFEFLIVKDFAGIYIYSWEANKLENSEQEESLPNQYIKYLDAPIH